MTTSKPADRCRVAVLRGFDSGDNQVFTLTVSFREYYDVTLLDHLRDLRDVSRLMPWIARTTYHHALRVAMRNRRHEGMPASLAADPDLEASMADLPGDLSERITALHEQQIVGEAMALLSPRCRELLTALFLSDSPMSYAEAAQHLDVPVGSIGPTRNRCLQRLRALLDTMDF